MLRPRRARRYAENSEDEEEDDVYKAKNTKQIRS